MEYLPRAHLWNCYAVALARRDQLGAVVTNLPVRTLGQRRSCPSTHRIAVYAAAARTASSVCEFSLPLWLVYRLEPCWFRAVAPEPGLEPGTRRLTVACSTNWRLLWNWGPGD